MEELNVTCELIKEYLNIEFNKQFKNIDFLLQGNDTDSFERFTFYYSKYKNNIKISPDTTKIFILQFNNETPNRIFDVKIDTYITKNGIPCNNRIFTNLKKV